MRFARLLLLAGCCASLFAGTTSDTGLPSAPEPGTIVLLTGGLAAIGFVTWRRNRKR